MRGQNFGRRARAGRGGRGGEVIRIGGEERDGVGVGGDEKVEKAGGDDGALWDSASDVAVVGHGVVIPTGGRPATEIGSQPPDGIMVKGGCAYCFDEEIVVHDVEGLGKVQRHRGRAEWGFGFVEPGCNLVGEGEEGGGGGAVPSETMLGVRRLQVVGETGKEEPLQDLNGGAEEGNGAVG